MPAETPEITIDSHHPTGGAKIIVSVWLTEEERQNLIERITARETVIHDRVKTIEALQLTSDGSRREDTESDEKPFPEKLTWEVTAG